MSSSKGTGIIPSTFAFSFFTIIEKLQQDGFDRAYVRRLRAWLSANELTGMIRGDIKDMIQGLKLVHHQEAQTEDRAPSPCHGRKNWSLGLLGERAHRIPPHCHGVGSHRERRTRRTDAEEVSISTLIFAVFSFCICTLWMYIMGIHDLECFFYSQSESLPNSNCQERNFHQNQVRKLVIPCSIRKSQQSECLVV